MSRPKKNAPETKARQLNVRIEPAVYDLLEKGTISEFVRDAILEKLERDKEHVTCPTCKGVGYVKKGGRS